MTSEVCRDIPAVGGLPLLGNALSMFQNMPRFLKSSYDRYGTVFRIKAAGRPFTVLAGVDAVVFVNSAQGRECLYSRPSWQGIHDVFGADNSVIGNDGDSHARFRDTMRHGYSRHALDGRYDQIVDVIDDWLARFCAPGEEIRAVSTIQHLTIGEIGVAVAGGPFFEDVDDLRTLIHWATNVRLLKRWPEFMLKLPKYRNAKVRMDRNAARTLATFRARPPMEDDDFGRRLLDDLVAANRDDPDFITEHELPFNLFIPFMAGLDTASNTIAAVLGILAKHSDLLRQVRTEVDALFALPSFDEEMFFGHVPVLDGVVKETMRLYPSVPVLMRHARRPFEFDGHRIEAEEPIMVATSAPHFMPEIFPEPDAFDPHRYSPGRREHMQPGAYSPFGRGPHLCLGKRIAEVLIPLSAARLVHQRQFELSDPAYDFKGRYSYGTELALDLKLKVRERF